MSAFVTWSLVAAALVFWALRFAVSPQQAPAYAVPIDRAAPPRGDLARLFGAPPVAAVAEEARAEGPSRFRLVGVMAPRSSAPEGNGAYGLALIAVDGKPPRAFAVGAKLDTDLVLQSVGLQVPPKDEKAFAGFLETLAYPCADETGNPAYRLFLQ